MRTRVLVQGCHSVSTTAAARSPLGHTGLGHARCCCPPLSACTPRHPHCAHNRQQQHATVSAHHRLKPPPSPCFPSPFMHIEHPVDNRDVPALDFEDHNLANTDGCVCLIVQKQNVATLEGWPHTSTALMHTLSAAASRAHRLHTHKATATETHLRTTTTGLSLSVYTISPFHSMSAEKMIMARLRPCRAN